MASAALAGLLISALGGCTRVGPGSPPGAGAATLGSVRVLVANKSSEDAVSAVVYIDGVEVLRGSYAPLSRADRMGEVRLRLPLGVHRVRAVVGSETTEAEVTVTTTQECTCQILFYDEPVEFAPGRWGRLSVAQIYPC